MRKQTIETEGSFYAGKIKGDISQTVTIEIYDKNCASSSQITIGVWNKSTNRVVYTTLQREAVLELKNALNNVEF